ncbi:MULTISPECIES: hypothetical protein [Burkholderia cepacia complex]|uniref:hypothetical protein n=1 Tax=Burkholderia cepacia complex TaxID=87882 RepID=UPI0018DEC0E3|nr:MULTISPECIES: hypothetical protein [Burkholderia cepacia complex]MDR8045825.1 hypothetical protein [Burkholderia cenocepacia]
MAASNAGRAFSGGVDPIAQFFYPIVDIKSFVAHDRAEHNQDFIRFSGALS